MIQFCAECGRELDYYERGKQVCSVCFMTYEYKPMLVALEDMVDIGLALVEKGLRLVREIEAVLSL